MFEHKIEKLNIGDPGEATIRKEGKVQGGLRRSSESRASERSALTSFSEAARACMELGGNMLECPAGTCVCLKQTWEKHRQCDKVGRTAFHQVLEDIDLGTNPGEDFLEGVMPSLRLEAGIKETDFQEEKTGNTCMEIINLSKPTTQALAMAGTSISPNVIPRPARTASFEKMEEIQIHEPQLKSTRTGTLRNQPAVCVLTSLQVIQTFTQV